jgi:hypothetical protein
MAHVEPANFTSKTLVIMVASLDSLAGAVDLATHAQFLQIISSLFQTTFPLDVAALVEPLAVGWHAVKQSPLKPSSAVTS